MLKEIHFAFAPPFSAMSEPAPTRVLLADKQPLIRLGVRTLLEAEPDLDLVADTDSGEGILDLLDAHRPDVLVLGLNLPDPGSISVADHLLGRTPIVHLVALSAVDTPRTVYEMLALRTAAFVSKNDEPFHLITAIRAAAGGAAGYFSPAVARQLAEKEKRPIRSDLGLTRRELEVLRLVARGHRNPQIGQTLFISPATVRNHLAHIFDKIGVNRRAEAVAWAWNHGLVDD